ncbi:MAG: hypothetical protein PHC50_01625 [Candidatus Cloacimonetes bacterium]|nr:hypothetical protein [Candidatus Cloacimonadota bacterium]
MNNFYLFRVTIVIGEQISLFDLPHQKILKHAIESPSTTITKGIKWAIGNLDIIKPHCYYFKFWKTREVKMEKFQEGDYQDIDTDKAESTHVFMDVDRELVFIAENYLLSNKVESIGRSLARYLKRNSPHSDNLMDLKIEPIRDVNNVLQIINSAYSIVKMNFTFYKSNPDDSGPWIRMLGNLANKINSEKGKVAIASDSLNPDVVGSLAQEINVTNNTGSFTYLPEKDAPKKTVKIHEQGILSAVLEDVHTENHEKILDHMYKLYNDIYRRKQ